MTDKQDSLWFHPITIFSFLFTLAVMLFYCLFPKAGVYSPYALAFFVSFGVFYFLLCSLPNWVQGKRPLKKESKFKWVNQFRLSLVTPEKRIQLYRLLFAIFVFDLFFARFYSTTEDYLREVSQLHSDFMNPFETALSAIFLPLWNGVMTFILLAAYRPDETMRQSVKWIVTPIAFLCALTQIYCYQGALGNIPAGGFNIRAFLMGIEIGSALAYCLSVWKEDPSFTLPYEYRYSTFLALFLILLCDMATYTPMNFFGEKSSVFPVPLDFNITHRITIYLDFLLPFLYFCLLYPLKEKNRRDYLTFISLAAFLSYIGFDKYVIWETIESFPLHICNTAMYTMPLTLLFNMVGVFYFTVFVNVIGALLALMMPNYSASLGVFSPRTLQFYVNHWYAFFLPVLILILKVYKRPKLKYFGYSMIGFAIYFLLVSFINIYETPRLEPYDRSIDFFFINSSFIADKIGNWAQRIFKLETTFTGKSGYVYTIRWLYLLLYYLIYCAFSLAMWFLYELLFKGVDDLSLLFDRMGEERRRKHLEKGKEDISMAKKIKIEEKKKALTASLKVNHVSKQYAGASFYALKDANLDLKGGKIYGFLGKNGAGKSTLIKAIVGLHGVDEGNIEVCGIDVARYPSLAKMQLGYVPDNYALYENLTGRQYISYMADLYDVSEFEREERLPSLLDRLEMQNRFDLPIKTYSHGMKQKITIIGALIHDPDIWILDEPMTGLDPNSIFQIKELMREHAKRGKIVFFSSHLIDIVNNLCDEVIIIKHGVILERDSLKDLTDQGIDLEEHFLRLTADSEEEEKKLIKEEKEFKK